MKSVISTQALHKHYGSIHAVDGIDLSVKPGEIYGLLGPNGSGKTTLIRLLIGLLRPTSGQVTLLDTSIPNKAVLAQVGYMTQACALYEDLSVKENLVFFAAMCNPTLKPNYKRIEEVLQLVNLTDRSSSMVRTLSGGMKQRVSLAVALVHKPRLLLLDEPTIGVDPQLRVTFWSYFRQLSGEGVTIVVSSHVMDEAERCDRLGFMRNGQLLAQGSAFELRSQAGAATLEEAFMHFANQ